MQAEFVQEPSRNELLALIKAQAQEILALKAHIAQLERRLGLNSSNSSKPPSSDGLSKPARIKSLREPSERKPGGQSGHPGQTLRQVSNPDFVVDHHPHSCANCGGALSPQMSQSYSWRQVFDLPQPQPLVVTEHRAHTGQCPHCASLTRAAWPQGVSAPVQYGPRMGAFVTYLSHQQMLPEDRLARLMADLFGISICAATIASMSRACAARVQAFSETVRDLVANAAVKHMDETGFRVGGKTHWLHVSCTRLLAFYHVHFKRNRLLSNMVSVVGTVVHDHWRPYFGMPGVQHALCNAHILRELKALVEIEKESWAQRMQKLLRRACHAVNAAKGRQLKASLIALFDKRYDAITRQGLDWHESQPPLARAGPANKKPGPQPCRTGHNLLKRLSGHKQDVLRFLHDRAVAFTNNEAERDVRMMKLRQKISGGFRSWQAAMDFATIGSLLVTARKQGWNIINALTEDPATLARSLRFA